MNNQTINRINTNTMSREAIEAALVGAAIVTDGVSEPWEPTYFLAALGEPQGRPTGEYLVFTAEEWAEEVTLAEQDEETNA